MKFRRALVVSEHESISVARQCQLLGLARSSCYYEPVRDDGYNERLMRLIDEQYTHAPSYGPAKMTRWLQCQGHMVNHKRVERLMRRMGLRALIPRLSLSGGGKEHQKYPYLLRQLSIERPNQVWSSDITYIPMRRGFLYLVAVMDWFSRYVLAWELSNSLESGFCVNALHRALQCGQPQIFNTDQGVQFTSEQFTGHLARAGIAISMDGKGRCFDNIFIERLWRSVKYEEVYLKDYTNAAMARRALHNYFAFYNDERLHQALNYRTPAQVHFSDKPEGKNDSRCKPQVKALA